MSTKKVKVALIGCGGQAANMHFPSLKEFEDVDIVGACDINEKRLNEIADKFEIEKRFTDYKKLIETTAPDAVYAIAFPQFMIDIWYYTLGAGINLFLEKPPGHITHQARIMSYLAEKNNCIATVGLQRRHSPVLVKAKKMVEEGGGPVHLAVSTFYKYFGKPNINSGDHLLNDGIHAIDTLRWMCGGEVKAVHPASKSAGEPDINMNVAVIEFDNGSTGILLTHFGTGRRTFRVEMHSCGMMAEGDMEDRIRVYDHEKGFRHADQKPLELIPGEVAGNNEARYHGGCNALDRMFIDAIKNKTPAPCSIQDSIKNMEIIDMIRKAHIGI